MKADDWLRCVIDVVRKFADDKYQRNAWFGVGDQVSSPEEMYCELFDDYIYENFLSSTDINLTEQQRDAGSRLKDELNKYSTDSLLDPEKVIDDPNWLNVVEAAKNFLRSFDIKE